MILSIPVASKHFLAVLAILVLWNFGSTVVFMSFEIVLELVDVGVSSLFYLFAILTLKFVDAERLM